MATATIIEAGHAKAVADWVCERVGAALERSDDSIAITVPGGSTPFPIFGLAAKSDVNWSRISLWPNDDRLVEPDHAASNTGRLQAIFGPIGAHVVALSEGMSPPRFALAWLGMGTDGHIASLFPNTDPQVDDPQTVRRLTPDPLPPEAPFDRITLTLPSLLNSDEILFTLGGSVEKRRVFDAAMAGQHDLPIARFLGAARQAVTCFA